MQPSKGRGPGVSQLLDCTFRDGGYQFNWDWPDQLVSRHLQAISLAGLRFCEIGFRNMPANGYRGSFYYTPESLLESIAHDFVGELGAMVDVKQFLPGAASLTQFRRLIGKASTSHLSFLRLAAASSELDTALNLAEAAKSQGFNVWLNVMKAADLGESDIEKVARLVEQAEFVTQVVLADTFGQWTPTAVASQVRWLSQETDADVGVHCHNNLGLAVANSISAIDSGASWVDATMTGVGRGPGNAELEVLAALGEVGTPVESSDLMQNAFLDFEPLKSEGQWGYSPVYAMSALARVHPSYGQEILHSNIPDGRKWETLKAVAVSQSPAEYRGIGALASPVFGRGESDSSTQSDSLEDLVEVAADSYAVVVLGGGKSVAGSVNELKALAQMRRLMILDSTGEGIRLGVTQYLATSYLSLSSVMKGLKRETQIPDFCSITDANVELGSPPGEDGVNQFESPSVYARKIGNEFAVRREFCTSPSNHSGVFALLLAARLRAKRIWLLGFEGEDLDPTTWKQTQDCITWLRKANSLVSLSTTSFEIPCSSVSAQLLRFEQVLDGTP